MYHPQLYGSYYAEVREPEDCKLWFNFDGSECTKQSIGFVCHQSYVLPESLLIFKLSLWDCRGIKTEIVFAWKFAQLNLSVKHNLWTSSLIRIILRVFSTWRSIHIVTWTILLVYALLSHFLPSWCFFYFGDSRLFVYIAVTLPNNDKSSPLSSHP